MMMIILSDGRVNRTNMTKIIFSNKQICTISIAFVTRLDTNKDKTAEKWFAWYVKY